MVVSFLRILGLGIIAMIKKNNMMTSGYHLNKYFEDWSTSFTLQNLAHFILLYFKAIHSKYEVDELVVHLPRVGNRGKINYLYESLEC